MRSPLLRFGLAAPGLCLPLLLALPASAQLPTKPLLSEAIRTTIEEEGVDAARRRYQDIARNRRNEYEFDMKALVDLGSAYIQRGDMAKGQAIFEIATQAALVASGASLPESTAARRPRPTPAPRETEEAAARRRSLETLGPGRADLSRFHGVYGDPATQQRMPRNVFVDQSCEGHLRFGAMWGDVAPWVMKSTSDTEFVQGVTSPAQRTPIRVRFDVGGDGRAQALTHNLTDGGQEMRVVRLGDLPATRIADCRVPIP